MNRIESFLPEIEEAYLELHTWLSALQDSPNYRRKTIKDEIGKLLPEASLLSAAAQYYVLFPAHFFKVACTLSTVIGSDKLANWFDLNPRICLVDMGCGAGSASAAFVNCLLKLKQEMLITQPIEIYCVGVDVNLRAIPLYNQMMLQIKSRVSQHGINLNHDYIPKGDLEALIQLKDRLNRKRKDCWQQPFLSDVFILQVNVVSPFSKRFAEARREVEELQRLGIDPSTLGDYHQAFGIQEATAYKQLLEEVAIDNLHIVTIGTDGYETRVQEMSEAIKEKFSAGKHKAQKIEHGERRVHYLNPPGSYWKEQCFVDSYHSAFHVDVTTVVSAQVEDGEWAAVIDIGNLQLAWARARHHLLDDSLADEVEIRLFESDLDGNIEKLRQQLLAYREEVVQSDGRLYYRFPKGENTVRPRGLSRIEEEILSTALIQKLGARLAGLTHTSFANKFSQVGGSEYLYENWFNAYTRFIERACAAARSFSSGIVIRLDIKSFYTRIIRDQLKEIAVEQLAKSERIKWLVRLLLSKDIDEHEAGLGIVQGNLGSGFFANLYLLDLDSRFPNNNQWEAQFFRYVDDMIVVLPDSNQDTCVEIIGVVRDELNNRGLELNDGKTEILSPQDFLNDCALDEEIEKLKDQYDKLIPPLWVLNADVRKMLKSQFRDSNDQWWDSISIYHNCLQALGLFFKETVLSRRITTYLFNLKKRNNALNGRDELSFPVIPAEVSMTIVKSWANAFVSANQEEITGLELLRSDLKVLFHQSLDGLAVGASNKNQERKLIRRVRYSANRLSEIGYGEDVAAKLVELLTRNPWLFRDITEIIENLARQQFNSSIKLLLDFYSQAKDEMAEYMKAISIRAVRFLDQIDVDLWDEVARSAFSPSIVICLLATETWLSVGQRCRHLIKSDQLDEVEAAFRTSSSSRLRKNYLLILAKFRAIPQDHLNLGDDSLLTQAFDIAVAGTVDSLLDYQEPEIIKSRYYSGTQDDDKDYDLPS
ncbi:MAG TPA: RNA-directed DNA polymerase [Blastocatellia bacterium]|nr:RNA-directed DNA polymerase [Blastocatellia bacterium]HMV85446.1 RNA-directed DNA polymerase [Blastocatellia bacterium]HMX24656.1 RNA-directed DNA polymerase [Blastocatellia bacterium]HMY70569.1 RNA-directed DNA polymerase [Blastocatellia bacterium]HMZ18060.1 RNA-directed DNA polymerase [Blastocatellia bacterium]